jgi:hypothetical protein
MGMQSNTPLSYGGAPKGIRDGGQETPRESRSSHKDLDLGQLRLCLPQIFRRQLESKIMYLKCSLPMQKKYIYYLRCPPCSTKVLDLGHVHAHPGQSIPPQLLQSGKKWPPGWSNQWTDASHMQAHPGQSSSPHALHRSRAGCGARASKNSCGRGRCGPPSSPSSESSSESGEMVRRRGTAESTGRGFWFLGGASNVTFLAGWRRVLSAGVFAGSCWVVRACFLLRAFASCFLVGSREM